MLLLLSSAFCRNFEEIVLLSYLKITKACSNDLRRAKKNYEKKGYYIRLYVPQPHFTTIPSKARPVFRGKPLKKKQASINKMTERVKTCQNH